MVPVIFFIFLSVFALMKAPAAFSWFENSLSTLGAQALDDAWLMNAAWIGFGALIVVIAVLYHEKEELPQALTYPLIVFGISVIFLGIWRYDNIFDTAEVDFAEVEDHVIFYRIALISFVILMILHTFLSKQKMIKMIHILCTVLMIIMMIILKLTTIHHGFYEKVIWVIMLTWLIMMFGRVEQDGNLNRF